MNGKLSATEFRLNVIELRKISGLGYGWAGEVLMRTAQQLSPLCVRL